MEAIRRIERVSGTKLTLELPASLHGKQVEVIVLELPNEERPAAVSSVRRQPPAMLAGKMMLHDDLISPAVPETDWEVR